MQRDAEGRRGTQRDAEPGKAKQRQAKRGRSHLHEEQAKANKQKLYVLVFAALKTQDAVAHFWGALGCSWAALLAFLGPLSGF